MSRESGSLSEQMRQRYSKTAQILEREIERAEILLASEQSAQREIGGQQGKIEGIERDLKRFRDVQSAFMAGNTHEAGCFLGIEREKLDKMIKVGDHPTDDIQEFIDARKELGFDR